MHEKYHILRAELYYPVKSFDEKLCICETCHRHLYKNKMDLDSIPDELKSIKKSEKIVIFNVPLFKKIEIMHGTGELSKIKGSICNIPIKAANICNILPRLAVFNGLVVVKLKRDLKYRGHVYFGPVPPHIIYQALAYFKIT